MAIIVGWLWLYIRIVSCVIGKDAASRIVLGYYSCPGHESTLALGNLKYTNSLLSVRYFSTWSSSSACSIFL